MFLVDGVWGVLRGISRRHHTPEPGDARETVCDVCVAVGRVWLPALWLLSELGVHCVHHHHAKPKVTHQRERQRPGRQTFTESLCPSQIQTHTHTHENHNHVDPPYIKPVVCQLSV